MSFTKAAAWRKVLRWLVLTPRHFWLALFVACSGCDYRSTIDTSTALVISDAHFDAAKGYELPYIVFAPSSIQGWELTTRTQLRYDRDKAVYHLDGIPASAPVVDTFGPRFKICGENWSNQFGFSDHVPSEETTFGVSTSGTILSIQRVPFATSDMHMEFSQHDLTQSPNSKVRIEFKVTDNSDSPKALVRVSLY